MVLLGRATKRYTDENKNKKTLQQPQRPNQRHDTLHHLHPNEPKPSVARNGTIKISTLRQHHRLYYHNRAATRLALGAVCVNRANG
jgi:hypothetical protein